MRAQTRSAFTLVELVMVIVIIGLLAAVAMPKFTDMRAEARWSPAEGEAVRFEGRGRPSLEFPFLESGGRAELSLRGLNLSRFGVVDPRGGFPPPAIGGRRRTTRMPWTSRPT